MNHKFRGYIGSEHVKVVVIGKINLANMTKTREHSERLHHGFWGSFDNLPKQLKEERMKQSTGFLNSKETFLSTGFGNSG